ncbi:MAG: hypothetical protein ACI86S_001180 [Paracoccaceae bacterium]|jgi:hypothetical protein
MQTHPIHHAQMQRSSTHGRFGSVFTLGELGSIRQSGLRADLRQRSAKPSLGWPECRLPTSRDGWLALAANVWIPPFRTEPITFAAPKIFGQLSKVKCRDLLVFMRHVFGPSPALRVGQVPDVWQCSYRAFGSVGRVLFRMVLAGQRERAGYGMFRRHHGNSGN